MCNLYTQTRAVEAVRRLFAARQMPLTFPEGVPNLAPADIRITDPGPIVRASSGQAGTYEMVIRRWSWPGPGGRPVFNFRSDGREFDSGRCLVVADGFYEFTVPDDPKEKKKRRWLFTDPVGEMLGIAGLWRTQPQVGEAFTMLTTEPGPDVAPYHGRQVAVLGPDQWKPWLDGQPAGELLRPAEKGTLLVRSA
jgi:putative SOS response-associated peptidase YedK